MAIDLSKAVADAQAVYDDLYARTKVALDNLGVAKMNLAASLVKPKITVVLLDETKAVPDAVMANYAKVLQDAINLARTKWTQIPETIVTRNKTVGGWEVAISNDPNTRRPRADGWHNVSPTGLGYAYIVGGSGMFPYGTYFPAKPDRVIGKTSFPATPESLRSGVLTVLVHETLEMLVDPAIKTFSTPDKAGRKWLIEVCSASVFGTYWHYKEPVSGVDCVMPNFAYPSAFDLAGLTPFDKMGVLHFPFDRTAKSYPAYLAPDGKTLLNVPLV